MHGHGLTFRFQRATSGLACTDLLGLTAVGGFGTGADFGLGFCAAGVDGLADEVGGVGGCRT